MSDREAADAAIARIDRFGWYSLLFAASFALGIVAAQVWLS